MYTKYPSYTSGHHEYIQEHLSYSFGHHPSYTGGHPASPRSSSQLQVIQPATSHPASHKLSSKPQVTLPAPGHPASSRSSSQPQVIHPAPGHPASLRSSSQPQFGPGDLVLESSLRVVNKFVDKQIRRKVNPQPLGGGEVMPPLLPCLPCLSLPLPLTWSSSPWRTPVPSQANHAYPFSSALPWPCSPWGVPTPQSCYLSFISPLLPSPYIGSLVPTLYSAPYRWSAYALLSPEHDLSTPNTSPSPTMVNSSLQTLVLPPYHGPSRYSLRPIMHQLPQCPSSIHYHDLPASSALPLTMIFIRPKPPLNLTWSTNPHKLPLTICLQPLHSTSLLLPWSTSQMCCCGYWHCCCG